MQISAADTAAGGVAMMVWEKGGGLVYLLKISRRCAQGKEWYFAGYPAAGYCHIFPPNDRVYNETADERKLTQMNTGGRWLYLDDR